MSARVPEISKSKGTTKKLFDDAVTVQINMKEQMTGENSSESTKSTENSENADKSPEPANRPKLEIKVTINMKQIERHHREIEMYVSPFPIPQDSIYLRIPLKPADFDRIEKARDELDQLVRTCNQLMPEILPPLDARLFLSKLRKLDIRCSALYPRPSPGNKRTVRMCPQFEPEIEDIESETEYISGILQGVRYFHNIDIARSNHHQKTSCT